MRARKPALRGLRKSVSRLLAVDAFKNKIVAEDEPIARAWRTGEPPINWGYGDVHFDFQWSR
jgi:hypothetical protein